jgi:hypothetical protein
MITEPQQQVPIYNFGTINFKDLEEIVVIKRNVSNSIFSNWFENDIEVSDNDQNILDNLINENAIFIDSYKEEELKVKFIAPILNRVKFTDIDHEIRDFYEEKISYKTDKFILTGITDFLVSRGLEYSKKPYFFIEEFKKSIKNDDPRPQLIAELIAAVELNNFKIMKGAYIVGAIWNFVILEKLAENKYQYFISINFDSTKIADLTAIYKNLVAIKEEIFQMLD